MIKTLIICDICNKEVEEESNLTKVSLIVEKLDESLNMGYPKAYASMCNECLENIGINIRYKGSIKNSLKTEFFNIAKNFINTLKGMG